MKLINVLPVSFAAVIVSTGMASASSYSSNTYVNGHETGTRQVYVNNVRTEVGHTSEFSESVKLNTDFPNAAGYIEYSHGSFDARLDVSTRNIDPSIVGGYSSQSTFSSFTDVTTTRIKDNVDYFNSIYSHTLESGNN